ncbi:uncharacterized protein il11b [Pseudorasbora parva]|uniref:uncharacterized protein il11b n=1 Tax=Pseudorasbora parva TaxID=51549 RepID=UPI00351EA5F7
MTCVDLFGSVIAHSTANIPQGKKGLQILYDDMLRLFRIVSQKQVKNKLNDFEQALTSLPSLNFKTEDLKSLELSSTLAQLSSGLASFKFHLDWIQQKQDEIGDDYSETKKINRLIQGMLAQFGTPPELVYPSLPPLNTAWSLHQANVEIYQKLYFFCNWYIRALRVLKHKQH